MTVQFPSARPCPNGRDGKSRTHRSPCVHPAVHSCLPKRPRGQALALSGASDPATRRRFPSGPCVGGMILESLVLWMTTVFCHLLPMVSISQKNLHRRLPIPNPFPHKGEGSNLNPGAPPLHKGRGPVKPPWPGVRGNDPIFRAWYSCHPELLERPLSRAPDDPRPSQGRPPDDARQDKFREKHGRWP
jgi:hypothetical protein